MDKMHLMLTELCSSYGLGPDFIVFEHIVVPTEFLLSHLETRLTEYAEQNWWLYSNVCEWCSVSWKSTFKVHLSELYSITPCITLHVTVQGRTYGAVFSIHIQVLPLLLLAWYSVYVTLTPTVCLFLSSWTVGVCSTLFPITWVVTEVLPRWDVTSFAVLFSFGVLHK